MPMAAEENGDRSRFRRGHVPVAALLVVAAVLRLRALGGLGTWIDESLTWMGADAIHRVGAPWLPSGCLYPRSPAHLFLTALSTLATGLGETGIRLPSVAFSLALILVVYVFARDLFGRPAGILAVALLTFSPWDIHYARMGRMYEMSAFLYTLTAFLACRAFTRSDRRAFAASLVAAALAVFTHRQGAALALVFLIPWFFPSEARPRRGWMIGSAAACCVALAVLLIYGAWGYGRGPTIATPQLYTRAIMLPIIGPIDLNDARWILLEASRTAPLAALLPLAAFAIAAAWWGVRAVRGRHEPLVLAACAGWAIALLFNQLLIAFVMILLVIKGSCRDARCAFARGGLLLAATAAWIFVLFAVAVWAWGFHPLLHREFLRAFFALPVPWYRLPATQFPWMTLAVLGGSAVIFLRSLPPGRRQDRFFAAAAFFGPLLFMGVFAAPYRLHRYTFYLNGVFVVLFAGAATGAAAWAGRRIRNVHAARGDAPAWAAAAATLAVGLLLLVPAGQFDPLQGWRVAERAYGDNRDLLRDPDLVSHFYYDLQAPARYVADHFRDGDLVIARDPVGLWPYLRTLHYVVRSPYYGQAISAEGRLVDLYLGIPLLSDAASLLDVVGRHRAGAVWIVYSESVPGGPDVNTPPDVLTLLDHWADRRVFTARDGITHVMRVETPVNSDP